MLVRHVFYRNSLIIYTKLSKVLLDMTSFLKILNEKLMEKQLFLKYKHKIQLDKRDLVVYQINIIEMLMQLFIVLIFKKMKIKILKVF